MQSIEDGEVCLVGVQTDFSFIHQGASCPSGFPLKRVKKSVLHWGCDLCGSTYAIGDPWRWKSNHSREKFL